MTPTSAPRAEIAIIGGSGFSSLFSSPEHVAGETPFGAPSAPVTVGELGGRAVAFLPRHGLHHEYAPHRVPYRANITALAALGVSRIFAPCAVGSLRHDLGPGSVVIPDQLVDLTAGREQTFFEGDAVRHASFADPYCPELRSVAVAASKEAGISARPTGTVVTISGPRFSTRAEAAWYRSAGWDLVNMTQCPEAALARELGICYCAVALVTDRDTGDDCHSSVEATDVFAVLASMVPTALDLLGAAVRLVPPLRSCRCLAPAA
ncbi:MAG: methylthioadenosine phosphorylase [Acidimicrobiaceae bacterium]|nr:methylthioadenosine phosphorylase [Acidimicrobiaceae bacterium]